jgi:dihydroorotase
VLEHITTAEAVRFVAAADANVAATITAHHLLYNRNALFAGGVRPHHYCLPVLKREQHRQALVAAATSGNPKFCLGTDSAPHTQVAKEAACGCAGCYTAPFALELYAETFAAAQALDRLEGFASFYGADFYGLPRNTGQVTLQESPQDIPAYYAIATEDAGHGCVPLIPEALSSDPGSLSIKQRLTPFRAGETLAWCLLPANARL